MRVGVCQINIFINESFSLKDKRRVMNSVKQRLRNKFNVSVIEESNGTNHKEGVLGVSCIGIDEAGVRNLLERVVLFLEDDGRFEITGLNTEIY
ncbi:MAG: uncharacterized protein PWP60_750 [Candidatus Atribacteria bacterium]|jgi:hypothetical protein|nr:uncharacterized protein [Candidatus Atribacteria bacterium]